MSKTQRERIINNLVGIFFVKNFFLCSDPSSFGKGNSVWSFEKPIFVDKEQKIALGRAVQYKSKGLIKSELTSKNDGVSLDNSLYLHSYNMVWDRKTQQFEIKIVDNSDTGIWFIYYSGERKFNFQRIETSDISEGIQKPTIVENTCICVHQAFKINNIKINMPSYDDLFKKQKK